MSNWTTSDAVFLCRMIERICPQFGCHIALTGGTLYKDGPRKDVDIIFYNIRQVDDLDRAGLLDALVNLGFYLGKQCGWCQKATFDGRPVDLFFPEQFPSSRILPASGGY